MEHIEEAGVHSGDSSCSLPPYSLSPAIQDELRRQVTLLAQRARRRRADEHAVRDPVRQGLQPDGLHPRSQPARVAHGAVRVQGDRRRAREDRGALHDRQDARRSQNATREVVPRLLLGQGSDLPVPQVPGRRSDPRPRDALDRRGHGHRAATSAPRSRARTRPRASRRRRRARRSCRCAMRDKERLLEVAIDLVARGFTPRRDRRHAQVPRASTASSASASTRCSKAGRTSSI